MSHQHTAPADVVWNELTRKHGERCVMSIGISQADVDAETARQVETIFPLIAAFAGRPHRILDFGAGAGRFVPALADMCEWLTVYEPSQELREAFQASPRYALPLSVRCRTVEVTGDNDALVPRSYDLVFVWIVFSSPTHDIEKTAARVVDLVRPGGALVLVDHMQEPKQRLWAIRRPEAEYLRLFARYGMTLQVIERARQLAEPITVMGGRRAL